MPCKFWKALELVPGPAAIAPEWRRHLGSHFPAFHSLCLEPAPDTVTYIPCPKCGCSHFVIPRHDLTAAIAVCCCNPPNCPDIPLTNEQITPLQIDWNRLSRAIADALAFHPRLVQLPPPATYQVASRPSDAMPVIVTMPMHSAMLRAIIAEIGAHLRQQFFLFTPTSRFVDFQAKTMLQNFAAAIRSLDSTFRLNPGGSLTAVIELSSLFTPAHSSLDTRLSTLVSGVPPSPLRTPNSPLDQAPSSPILHPSYSLRRGHRTWHLIFNGQHADLKTGRGLLFVAWIFTHPDETPIHPIDLIARIPELYRSQTGLAQISDPLTGKSVALPSHSRIQERSLAIDDAKSLRSILRKQHELETILDSDSESEPVKAEALRELEAIAEFQKKHARTSRDNAYRTAHTVRQSITRLYNSLNAALDAPGNKHPVLHPFAQHIHQFLILPSTKSRKLIYRPPHGIRWS